MAYTQATPARSFFPAFLTPRISTVAVMYGFAFLLVAGWCMSVMTFGLPGLFIPAVAAVPVMMLVLVRLAWG